MEPRTGQARLRRIALILVVVGVAMVIAGVLTYVLVSVKLADQQITVSEDAAAFAGQKVDQPWEAFAQANVIAEHANQIAGGKTYAQLPQDDPNRQTVMTASFLQASLFTSVVAFGVAVMAAVMGLVLLLVGMALRSLARSGLTGDGEAARGPVTGRD
jgi:ABC-type sugar transport system permease subunit